MKEVYLKITLAILFIVCAVLIGIMVKTNGATHVRIQKMEELEKKNKELSEKIQEPSERFYFVTKGQAQALENDKNKKEFAVPEKDQILAKKIAGNVTDKTPAGVRDAFIKYLKGVETDPIIYKDSTKHLLKDRDTLLLEETCKHFGMTVKTKLYWDMQLKEHFCFSEIRSSADSNDAVSFYYRKKPSDENPANLYCQDQDKIHTVVLAFNSISLSNKDFEITNHLAKIPVGGHYIHMIEVHRAEDSNAEYWYLEYKIDLEKEIEENGEEKDAEHKDASSIHMNAISLLPGNPVESHCTGEIQTFRVPFVNGTSKLLISADKIVFPDKVKALPESKDFGNP